MPRRSSLVLAAVLVASTGAVVGATSSPSSAAAAETWRARGVIESFAADRTTVSIAHEAIPGYMGAMTMSFEAERADQLAALVVGDKVAFTFTDTDDGRRVITSITKR